MPQANSFDDAFKLRLLGAITEAQAKFISEKDSAGAFDHLLQCLLELTSSEYGFIGRVLHDANGCPYLKTHAITDISWNEETRRFYRDNAPQGLEFYNLDTLFGYVIKTGEVLIANRPASHPHAGGIPEGHPALNSFLGLPISIGKNLLGMVGIANRRGGYCVSLVKAIEPFSTTLVNLFSAYNADLRARNTAEKIRASEEKIRTIVEHLPDAFVVVNAAGEVEMANSRFNQLLDYAGDMTGQSLSRLSSRLDNKNKARFLQQLLDVELGDKFETNRETQAATMLPLEVSRSELQLSGEKYHSMVIRDIRQRKEFETHIERYSEVLESLHAITITYHETIEERMQRLLKVGLQTFGLDIGIISHIQGQDYYVEFIDGKGALPQAGTRFDYEATYCSHTFKGKSPTAFAHAGKSEIRNHPCYKTFQLEAYIGAPIFVQGRRYGTLNFSSPQPRNQAFSPFDLSLMRLFSQWVGAELSRWQTANDLRRFKYALDHTGECIFMFDASNYRIFYVNEGTCRQLSYAHNELLGRTPFDLLSDESVAELRSLMAHMSDSEETFCSIESSLRDKHGNIFPAEVALQYLQPKDEPSRFIVFARDITERKKADKAKSEFVSTVSHELRTPLTSIRGALGLVMGGAVGSLPDKISSLLEIAYGNTERLLLLINDILDLQKIEAGQLDFSFDSIDITVLLQDALELNQAYAEQYGVHFQLAVPDRQVWVLADATRLMQVMSNLLSNAAKFSPDGAAVDITLQVEQGSVRVSVRDHGVGIAEAERHRVFHKFSQIDASDTRQTGGTGLGLAISKQLVERHGGRIGFTSQQGKGSCFYFELTELIDPGSVSDLAVKENQQQRPRILVIDDEPEVAQIIMAILQRQHYDCDMATSIAQARAKMATHHYNGVTLDIVLPRESGIDYLQELRAQPKYKHFPVVVISQMTNELKRRFPDQQLGEVFWLDKPFEDFELVSALEKLLVNA